MSSSRAQQDPPQHAAPSEGATPPPLNEAARLRLLLESIRDYAIFMLDADGRVVTWNEGAAQLLGYTEAEITGQHFSIFYTSEERRIGKPQAEQRLAERQGRFEDEGYRVRKDGSRFWGNEIISAIRDESGGVLLGYAKIVRDLSERKRVEEAMRESEERHRLLVENIRDHAVFMLDPEGRVATWNPGAERVFGYADQEVLGQNGSMLFTPEDRAAGEHAKELATALSEGRASDDRWQMRKGGQRFFASGITSPLRDASGGLRGFVKVCRDLTDRQQVQEQRERLLEQEKVARLEAEKAITMKDEFIAVVSHELRTPLTAILLWSKMLRAGLVKPEEQPRVIDTIEQSAMAQQQVVEDLLDVSRMMSGKLRLNVRETEPVPVVQAAIDAVRPMADAKGLTLETDLDPRAGTVRADADRLQQVVWNLVNNAVKFTPVGGRVTVTLRRLDGNLHVRVADDGKGIPPEFLPHVFDRFRQAETSTTRRHGGLGLGLAICRQLVELHGGTIRADSPGRDAGSTFTVELPLADVRAGTTTPPPRDIDARPPVPLQPAPALRGLSVLLVEDDPNTRLALRRLMEQAAAEVTTVESAAQAVAAFRDRLDLDRRFDVIVSDIAMPVQDGYELIRELRELESRLPNGRRVPAIALTAYAREPDRVRALASGFDTHLPKPLDPTTLVAAVGALAGRGVP